MKSWLAMAMMISLVAVGPCWAGPDLDRVIDYMFMDQTVPYKNKMEQFDGQRQIRLTRETRIGQTFVTGPQSARIARVRVSLAPAAFDTLLVPYDGPKMPGLKLTSIEKSADGLDSAFKVSQGSVVDLYAFQRSAKPKAIAGEKIAFDGERLFVRRVNGKPRSVLLVNGSSVRIDGKQVIKLAKPEKCVVVDFGKAGRKDYRADSKTWAELKVSGGQK